MQLNEAIALVKAAGYTVRKQVISRKKALSKVGPTFVANWNDGEITRMSIHCSDDSLDWGRAVRVSWAAYDCRTKGQGLARIINFGQFVRDDMPLEARTNLYVPDFRAAEFY